MIGILIWLLVGAVVGIVAEAVMSRGDGFLISIVVGVVGALLGGFIFNGPTINESISPTSIVVSIAGAIILLAVVNLAQRGRLR